MGDFEQHFETWVLVVFGRIDSIARILFMTSLII